MIAKITVMHTVMIILMSNDPMYSQQTTSKAQSISELNNTEVTGRLLMLASSNLPIGSYTYSQGIESAIESKLIYD